MSIGFSLTSSKRHRDHLQAALDGHFTLRQMPVQGVDLGKRPMSGPAGVGGRVAAGLAACLSRLCLIWLSGLRISCAIDPASAVVASRDFSE